MSEFSRPASGFRYKSGGMKVNSTPDALSEGKYPYLQNTRDYHDSSMRSRPQLTPTQTTPAAPGTILAMDAQLGVYKINSSLYYAGALIDTGYSYGVGASILPFRPDASPTAWDYVFDAAKGTKVSVAGGAPILAPIGVAEPQTPPAAAIQTTGVSQFTLTNVAWTQGGTAGVPTGSNRISDTVLAVFSDPDTPASLLASWYCQVAGTQQYQVGAYLGPLNLTGGGTISGIVQDVFPAFNPTSQVLIQSIYYYSGTTGRCVIVPTQTTSEGRSLTQTAGTTVLSQDYIASLRRGSLVSLAGEACIVASVTMGPTGLVCFEVTTTGTHAVGDVIFGVPCILIGGLSYLGAPVTSTQMTGATYVCTEVSSALTAGIGTLTQPIAALSGHNPFTYPAGLGANTPQTDDYVHISILLSDPTQLIDGKVIFDVGSGDYTSNTYYYSFRQSDLELAASNAQPLLQATQLSLQREYMVEEATAKGITYSDQLAAGTSQWAELTFPISALTRVGNDETKSLTTYTGTQLLLNVAGNVTVSFSSLWISVGNQVDLGDAVTPYYYCFRQRSSQTGARSNRSPITRYGLAPRRQQVLLTPDQTGLDDQCDVLDWYRQGGALEEMTYVGTQQRFLSSTFTDNYPDTYVVTMPTLETDNYQPWPTVDAPFTSVAVSVCGSTAVVQSPPSSSLVTQYLPGNLVVIGQQVYTLRSRPLAGTPVPTTLAVTAITYTTVPSGSGYLTTGTVTISANSPFGADSSFTFTSLTGTPAELNGLTAFLPGPSGVHTFPFYVTHPTSKGNYSGPTTGNITYSAAGYLFQFEENAGTQAYASLQIYEPDVANFPHPYVWGPDTSGRFFSVGDTLRPGFVSWTNPNNPDAASDAHTRELCPPTEPLQNGAVYDGTSCVASPNRWWVGRLIGGPQEYDWQEIPVGAGLAAPYAICSDGQKVYFWAKDGIRSHSGGPSTSLTDADLSTLFPHDGGVFPVSYTYAGQTVYAPDYKYASWFRLTVCNGYLYADYLDATRTPRTLVCNLHTGAWSVDIYADPITSRSVVTASASNNAQPASAIQNLQLYSGSITGVWYTESSTPSPAGEAVPWVVADREEVFGDLRAQKEIGDVSLDLWAAGGDVTAQPYNLGSPLGPGLVIPGGAVSRPEIPAIVPVGTLGVQVLARSVGLVVSGIDQGPATILYSWQPSYIPQPEDTTTRVGDWDDAGSPGNKWWQGFLLNANTYDASKVINVRNGDTLALQPYQSSNIVVTPGSALHNGQQIIAYAFDPPFYAHMVRVEGGDLLPWQDFHATWITEPAPEFGLLWQTQPTSHTLPGYQHVKQLVLAYNAPALVTLTLYVDGVALAPVTFPATTSYAKSVQTLPPNKGLVFQYVLTSTQPFQVWSDDIEIFVKPWGTPGPYTNFRQIGGVMSPAARI